MRRLRNNPTVVECAFEKPRNCPLCDQGFYFGSLILSWSLGSRTYAGLPQTLDRLRSSWSDIDFKKSSRGEKPEDIEGIRFHIQAAYRSVQKAINRFRLTGRTSAEAHVYEHTPRQICHCLDNPLCHSILMVGPWSAITNKLFLCRNVCLEPLCFKNIIIPNIWLDIHPERNSHLFK